MTKIKKIGQIAIAVSDLKTSLSFYVGILGLELLFEVPPKMAFLQAGDTRLMVTELQGNEQDHKTSTVYYQVDDIDAYWHELSMHDVTIEQAPQLTAKMPDHELWLGFVRDPDGNLLSIMAEKPLS
ncbi:VOC family protein [Thalassotalea sp. PS06]|uniref:VOC family protein n=1 Tax=Thalassotalea sp. PS06 TaxID=2594005 RepID=UPI00163D758D|nr:VOC family protein [Thalassotalea sp. PS06]